MFTVLEVMATTTERSEFDSWSCIAHYPNCTQMLKELKLIDHNSTIIKEVELGQSKEVIQLLTFIANL